MNKKNILTLSVFAILISLFIYRLSGHMVRVSSFVNGRNIPIYKVQTDKKLLAISFDAAWGNEDTKDLLDILKRHHVKATFFMTGGWVDQYPEDVKRILAEGHDLGNHSQNHKQMSSLSKEEIDQEILSVHDKVKELTGYNMKLFRPPYGDYNSELIQEVQTLGYYPIQWSVDSLDWKDLGVDEIINKVCRHKDLGNGAIILCHNGAKYTKDALDALLTKLEQEYTFVPISDLIYTENYHMLPDGTQVSSNSISEK